TESIRLPPNSSTRLKKRNVRTSCAEQKAIPCTSKGRKPGRNKCRCRKYGQPQIRVAAKCFPSRGRERFSEHTEGKREGGSQLNTGPRNRSLSSTANETGSCSAAAQGWLPARKPQEKQRNEGTSAIACLSLEAEA